MTREILSEQALLHKGDAVISAALAAVNPETLVRGSLSRQGSVLKAGDRIFHLDQIRDIRVAAIGKAAPYMAAAVGDILQDRVKEGICLYRPEDVHHIERFTGFPAPHPLPDERSCGAARAVLDMAKKSGPDDLLLLCISGGGSSQLSLPFSGVRMEEKRKVIELLQRAGADIRDLNTVRKHLSLIKGGQLARTAYPAAVVNLVISDVIGNDPETIASGPGWGDTTTFKDAGDVLRKFKLWDEIPTGIRKVIRQGILGKRPETPKPGGPELARAEYVIAGDNRTALAAARHAAEREGLAAEILTSADHGEARKAAEKYSRLFQEKKEKSQSPFCLIAGGELTVTVRGCGKGGRNQEFVLAFLRKMQPAPVRDKNWAVFSLGTDGIDGPTNAAGAKAGPSLLDEARLRNIPLKEYLGNNDSYSFFERAGGLIMTGPTHTNVMDIRLFLSG